MSGQWVVVHIVKNEMNPVLLHVVRHGVFRLVVELHDAPLVVQDLEKRMRRGFNN